MCLCVCVCLCPFLGRKSPNKGKKPNHKHIQERRKKRKSCVLVCEVALGSADARAALVVFLLLGGTFLYFGLRGLRILGLLLVVACEVPPNTKKRSQQWPECPQRSGSVPPNTKTKKPAVARVSAEFGVYLTHRHTDGPPKTQKKHYQGQPEYPQTPGSTSNTNMQERRKKRKKIPVYRQVPRQKKEPIPKGSPNICRPRTGKSKKRQRNAAQKGNKSLPKPAKASTDPGVHLKGQHTGQ